jgi:arginine decarboxylase
MTHSMIGWESETPIPNHVFNEYLSARDGHLYFDDLDLAQLFLAAQDRAMNSPLEIVYLPRICRKIDALKQAFDAASQEVAYAGKFLYAYPSKANMADEVVRTILRTGVHYEISSALDVDIVRVMRASGLLTRDQMVICNGFKPAGMSYADRIIELQREHGNVLPVIEDVTEIEPLVRSGLSFDIGLRQKSYGHHTSAAEMEAANSRFGMNTAELWRAAEIVASTPNLNFKLYHALVGSQIVGEAEFVNRLTPAIENYARLRQRFPSLSIFDFGGGVPAAMTLDFSFDYRAFFVQLLTTIQQVCDQYGVPVPDVMGEIGRYTVSEHGVHCFKVILTKDNGSAYPWYVINGSIMSSLPDSWALGEHFIVLPLNHLDKPFQRVQLGGITCDSDDVYPPKSSSSPLYLPVETQDLYIGFFSIGAYQEMLGGVGGTKHCAIPEADELIIDRDPAGQYQFQLLPGQNFNKVLGNLGYSAK